jgi:hypothetical protein
MTASGHCWLGSGARASAIYLILGVGLSPALAQPLDDERVPVAYLVDRSLFKAVERGEVLEFELHRDASCSEALHAWNGTCGRSGSTTRWSRRAFPVASCG